MKLFSRIRGSVQLAQAVCRRSIWHSGSDGGKHHPFSGISRNDVCRQRACNQSSTWYKSGTRTESSWKTSCKRLIQLRLHLVEAAGVEPASEKTSNRERSCFFQVLFCLVNGAKNGRRYAADQSDRSHSLRPDGTRRASLLCDAPEHARRRSVRERLLI